MPILSGGETTRIIREELKMDTPIIAVTANALQSEKTKCLANGFNDYSTKPFEEEELIQSIYNQITREKSIQFQPKSSKKITREDSNELYDLSILKKMSNDSAFISKMLQIFITTTPELIEDIKYNFKTKNFETLQKVLVFLHLIFARLPKIFIWAYPLTARTARQTAGAQCY